MVILPLPLDIHGGDLLRILNGLKLFYCQHYWIFMVLICRVEDGNYKLVLDVNRPRETAFPLWVQ